MKVLGLNVGHNSTACLIQDGEITHCVSEERFTRCKNFTGVPIESIEWILSDVGITAKDIDHVSILGANLPPLLNPFADRTTTKKPSWSIWNPVKKSCERMEYHWPAFGKWAGRVYRKSQTKRFKKGMKQLMDGLHKRFGFEKEQFMNTEHHLGHALCTPLLVPHSEKMLVFTCDGEGDNISATVSIYHDGKMERLAETHADDSPGLLYLNVTKFMGMRGNQDEFKVMGMAPYSKRNWAKKIYTIFKEILWFDEKEPLAFKSKYRMTSIEKHLRHLLYQKRFDWIAGGIQTFTEDLVCEWVRRAIDKTGIHNVALAGGVFMNVKANQYIAEMPEVDNVYVFPSGGDESGAIGAAVDGHLRMAKTPLKPLRHLYLGTDVDENLDELVKEAGIQERYEVEHCEDIEARVAQLLADGHVVSRFAGKMEWGARALGNRSILANPSNYNIIRIINEKIKNRDFWMPFAASVLQERAEDYIINPDKTEAPYMAITFDTTPLAKKEMPAAIHPYDFTVRPQIVTQEANPGYHKLIQEFEKITGIGAILNTSFNLHGEPNVQYLKDAIHTLDESGLNILAAENYLLTKR